MDQVNWSELERLVVQGKITRRVLLRRLLEAGGIAAAIGPGAALLAACGEPQKAAGPSGPVPPGYPAINNNILGKKVTLTILLAADYYNQPAFQALYTVLQKGYPDIKLNVTNAVWADIPTKVKTAALGGTPVDVAHQHAFVYGHTGVAEQVDGLWRQWGKVGDFLPNSLEDGA